MSEHEIQFGEVEETQHAQQLRPDANRQLAVVACGSPKSEDLPIYVDLDAMRDMELHALTDTSVELGGVMLGAQLKDDAGQPYVVIQDSLRARHYESSKGSFKFTHDTWADITRRREEFPSELQMVGWYHTHPDWGVFLSGMDMFICDHFFNRPLDVALVIDPCRDDRGWFQWTADAAERVRQTSGFYLIASRHRRAELEQYAAQLEGKTSMTHDPRTGGSGYPGVAYPVNVTNTPDPRNGWLALGVMGLLSMQFLLIVLLGYRLLVAPPDAATVADATAEQQAAEATSPLAQSLELQQQAAQIEAQTQLLNRVIESLDGDAPRNLVSYLEQQRQENVRLSNDVRAYQALDAKAKHDVERLTAEVEDAQLVNADLRRQLSALDQSTLDYKQQARDYKGQLEDLEKELKTLKSPDETADSETALLPGPWWVWAGGGVLGIALIGLGYGIAASQQGRRESFVDMPDDESASDEKQPGDEPEDKES